MVYKKLVIVSGSLVIAALKSFLTTKAKFSLLALLRFLCTAMVGDEAATPGRVRMF